MNLTTLLNKAKKITDYLNPTEDKDLETIKVFINLLQRYVDVEKKNRRKAKLEKEKLEREENIKRVIKHNRFKRFVKGLVA